MGDPIHDYRTLHAPPLKDPSPEGSALLPRLRLDQRQRWAQGERARAEDYLAAMSGLDGEAVLDLLFQEVALREEQGESVAVDELVQRFPDLETRIRRRFELHRALHAPGHAAADTAAGSLTSGLGGTLHAPVVEGPPPAPVIVPGYEILGELGRGGMGVVYKARQLGLDRPVALKMILSGAHAGPDEMARFRAEAEAVARVQHPNLVQIYEVGEHAGRPFFSLEFVDGGTLDARLDHKPQPPREAARLIETLARAAHAVHQRGIVHRDLKPANVLLTRDGTLKITDFGLAKRLDTVGSTLTGDVLGTPLYMAPEQAAGRGRHVSPQTDVYALGTILYEMLTGAPPFRGETAYETVRKVVAEEPVPPSRSQPRVPLDLETICLKCLEKDPGKRYASAEALADDLRRFLDDEPIRARPLGRLGRLIKWARRRPAAAALLAVSSLAAVTLLIGGWVYNVLLQGALAEAHVQREHGRHLLVRLEVASGARLLDEGNWFGALVWFTEALRLEEGSPEREEMHRLRIAAVLRHAPRLTQLWAHASTVRRAAFDAQGSRVATASEDGTARIWDVATGRAVTPPLEHGGPVVHVEFSGDGRKLLTASEDGTARIWDLEGKALTPPLKVGGPLACARFSPDGSRVVTASQAGIVFWQGATGQRLPLDTVTGRQRWAAVSPDGQRLVTAGEDGSARVWDAGSGKPLTPPLRHGAAVTHAAFSPDGMQVATAARDGTARLWGADGCPAVAPMRHPLAVNHIAFSPDGKSVVTASDDHTARVWDTATGAMKTLALRHGSDVNRAVFSPDGMWILTASDDNTARLWDARTGELMPPWLLHNGTVQGAAFSPDGRRVLTFSNDRLARLWDVTGALAHLCAGPVPDGEHIDEGGTIRAASPDGLLEARAEAGNRAVVREVRTGQPTGRPLEHGSFVSAVTFSPDGKRVATGSDDNTARLWEARTGRLLVTPLRHRGRVTSLTFSQSGKLVATASADQTARVWDAATGEPLTPALAHEAAVKHVAFQGQTLTLVTTTADGKTQTWSAEPERRSAAELRQFVEMLAAGRIEPDRGCLPLGAERVLARWRSAKWR